MKLAGAREKKNMYSFPTHTSGIQLLPQTLKRWLKSKNSRKNVLRTIRNKRSPLVQELLEPSKPGISQGIPIRHFPVPVLSSCPSGDTALAPTTTDSSQLTPERARGSTRTKLGTVVLPGTAQLQTRL